MRRREGGNKDKRGNREDEKMRAWKVSRGEDVTKERRQEKEKKRGGEERRERR